MSRYKYKSTYKDRDRDLVRVRDRETKQDRDRDLSRVLYLVTIKVMGICMDQFVVRDLDTILRQWDRGRDHKCIIHRRMIVVPMDNYPVFSLISSILHHATNLQ